MSSRVPPPDAPDAPDAPDDGGIRADRVLIVEDHPSLRRSLERTLAHRFPDVRSCGTRREALQLLRSYRPDLLLLDLVLPDGSGAELLRVAARSTPPPRILTMSGSAAARVPQPPDAGTLHTHLRKPITSDDLLAALAALGAGGPGARQQGTPGGESASGPWRRLVQRILGRGAGGRLARVAHPR